MSNSKISGLTSATTPLAGTETLPIVQSSTTKQVAVNNLTVQNIRANATTGILQITGPSAASTRVATVPDANWTAARTDAAQSFTGDQTLATGNLIQGTAAKGVDFSANSTAAGKTSTLLNWYEEGTWTPTIASGSGSITSYTSSGTYTRIGRQVTLLITFTITNNGTGSGDIRITGLPFATSANNLGNGCGRENATSGFMVNAIVGSSNTINVYKYDNSYPGGTSNSIKMTFTYFT